MYLTVVIICLVATNFTVRSFVNIVIYFIGIIFSGRTSTIPINFLKIFFQF